MKLKNSEVMGFINKLNKVSTVSYEFKFKLWGFEKPNYKKSAAFADIVNANKLSLQRIQDKLVKTNIETPEYNEYIKRVQECYQHHVNVYGKDPRSQQPNKYDNLAKKLDGIEHDHSIAKKQFDDNEADFRKLLETEIEFIPLLIDAKFVPPTLTPEQREAINFILKP